jgi:hypothetical protein
MTTTINAVILPLVSLVLFSVLSNNSKVTTTTTRITLQFDGSFRPPKDPGVSTIPRRLAVAAACLSMTITHHDENKPTLFPVAVGTRIVPIDINMSSQHVELEGLLLGLKYINENWVELMEKRLRILDTDTSCDIQADQITLMIQGDCKTVIDQLSGKAVPRKLEARLNKARNLLCQLLSRGGSIILAYNLVPRCENCVCDSLCSNLMNIVACKAWNDCLDDVAKVRRRDSVGASRKDDSFTDTPLSSILTSHLDPVNSVIKYSLRVPLYDKLATIARNCEDFDSLTTIGEWMEDDVERWRSQESASKAGKKRSIAYQVRGWRGLGNSKKAVFLERKHRIPLRSDGETEHGYSVLGYDELRSLGCREEEWEQSIPKQWRDVLSTWFSETMKHGGKDTAPFWVKDGKFHRSKE